MKIALTGAGGFLGSEILRQITADGTYNVIAITRNQDIVNRIASDINCSVVNPQEAICSSRILEGVSVLVNCAFPRVANGIAMARGLEFINDVFRVAKESDIHAVINISSQSVYSQHNDSIATESSDLCPESTYAVAKVSSELLLHARCSNMQHTNIRLASLIGPGFDQRVVNKLIATSISEGAMTIVDNGSRFGYLDVRDAASGIVKILRSVGEKRWNEAYNLGPDSDYSLTDIAAVIKELCESITGKEVSISAKRDANNNAPTYSTIDSSLFKETFGWTCSYTLADTVTSIIQQLMKAPMSN